MQQMDREGIVKARPKAWRIKTFENSQAATITIDFDVVAFLEGAEWRDWTEYQVEVSGDWWVVKKDGTVNEDSVAQLAKSLSWSPSFKAIQDGPPPQTVVQLTVKPDTYKGKTSFKATWMNPENFVPQRSTSPEAVNSLEARFGSLLRAAGAKAVKG